MAQCVKNPEMECVGVAEVQMLKQQVDSLSQAFREERSENRKEHGEFFDRLNSGERFQAVTQAQLSQIMIDTGEIKSDIKTLASSVQNAKQEQIEKPAKRWEGIVSQIISLVVATLFTFVAVKLGLQA